MRLVLSREQSRAFDRVATERHGVPGLVLMENAARGAADRLSRLLGPGQRRVLVLCGAGNNGGDGYALARRLRVLGLEVRVIATTPLERLSGDARVNALAYQSLGGAVEAFAATPAGLAAVGTALGEADWVIDALLGTGVTREVTGDLAALIRTLNDARVPVLSLDLPSGLDADTGAIHGVAVRARETVTFAQPKLGLCTSLGAELAGTLTIADIGVPGALVEATGVAAWWLGARDVGAWIEPRPLAAHKGSAGRVVVLAGSPGKTGAALLTARGALRAGAGLVTLAALPDVAALLEPRVLEAMTARLDPSRLEASLDALLEGADAVVIGPGLGFGAEARAMVRHVVQAWKGAKVLDADALTHHAGALEALARAPGELILTPHPGEMARLLGLTSAEVEARRFEALQRAVEGSGSVVLLKGARTLIGAGGRLPAVNSSGAAVLATAGSGDVLAGVVGALAARGSPFEAACCAAYVHGLSGERWARAHGADRGMLAREIADGVPGALAEVMAAARHAGRAEREPGAATDAGSG